MTKTSVSLQEPEEEDIVKAKADKHQSFGIVCSVCKVETLPISP